MPEASGRAGRPRDQLVSVTVNPGPNPASSPVMRNTTVTARRCLVSTLYGGMLRTGIKATTADATAAAVATCRVRNQGGPPRAGEMSRMVGLRTFGWTDLGHDASGPLGIGIFLRSGAR